MEINTILSKIEALLDEKNATSIHYLGKKRAFASAYMYELDLKKKSIRDTIADEYSKDMAYNRAEAKARTTDKYTKYLDKMSKAKLSEDLAINEHRQALHKMGFFEKLLSLRQSEMKLR